ncbi:CAP domain-containing protein [Clostridium polynesiense]|uniref:CAP domain-containing protein n=1 Tax=Clostridium polynesiense TaxID=1325933 RepID=UPI000693BD81|nr:CAP domain-containing protein [Clostridium polynesiense]
MNKIIYLIIIMTFLTSCSSRNRVNITDPNQDNTGNYSSEAPLPESPPADENSKLPNEVTGKRNENVAQPEVKPPRTKTEDPSKSSGKPPNSGSSTQTSPSAGGTDSSAGNASNDTPGINAVPETPAPPKDNVNIATGTLPAIPMKYSFDYMEQVENRVLELVNAERAKAGLNPVVFNDKLRQASRYKSNEMLQYNYFSHNSPYTNSPMEVVKGFGHSYNTIGENIWMMGASNSAALRTSVTAEKIVSSWMNSSGHRANILNNSFTKMGIGIVSGDNGKSYAAQIFTD